MLTQENEAQMFSEVEKNYQEPRIIRTVNLPIYRRMIIAKCVIVKPLSLICETLGRRDSCNLYIDNQ